ncbi:MAG: (Fe-S)-binding protein [Desulfobacterales bacterium CG23_combo_of_CG06-09_8_20_14_all_51_8]|nr:MAG: (Fe-S)-binding protein [Desulfobacterales bacterium CG23_combo_of_CG06-09_8_20_14_all_51_8]
MNPAAMGLLLFVSLSLFTFSVTRRFLPLFVMQPDNRLDNRRERVMGVLKLFFGQRRFLRAFERVHGIAHVMIFWGAVVVTLSTIQMAGRGFSPDFHLPGLGGTRLGLTYVFLKDLFTLSIMAGCAIAFVNRVVFRPARMILSAEALVILNWIFWMMVMDLLYESTLFVLTPDHVEAQAAFLGVFGKNMLMRMGLTADSAATAQLHAVGSWGHLILGLSFLNYLPYCKQFHEITSLPSIYMRSLKKKGALTPQHLEDEDAIFGVGKIEEFSFKRGLDMYSCAECGRCRANCPAYLTDKPLSPMAVIMDEREHLKKKTNLMCRAALHKFRKEPDNARAVLEEWDGEELVGGVISEDAIWACTTCGHCVSNCPLMVEHVDNIIDMRRHLVQVESRFPKELTQFFKGCENLSNPWSLASNTRGDWFRDLGVQTPEENPNFEYLFYVGCAGSFDDRYKKVSTSLVQLMQKAGVNFACLGDNEMCCGETARRLGNEYLAQHMINFNLEMFDSIGVKKIVTACPHCFNTLKNEYPQFGKTFQVIHHTELIRQLTKKGVFRAGKKFSGKGPVVYHDSCYLGRYNDLYDIPRDIARFIPGMKLVEAERRERTSFCCGAGGGRMWMEEKIGKRINTERFEQLYATGARTIATACPYCMIMLDDAVKEKGMEEEVVIMDLSQMMLQSVVD